jgi:hypothetical protein
MKNIIKLVTVVAVAIVTLTTTSYARIGLTKKQCTEKYGKEQPEAAKGGGTLYLVNGVAVTCYFTKDGKCGGVVYQPLQAYGKDTPKDTSALFLAIVTKNFGAAAESWDEDPNEEDVYISPDKKHLVVLSDKAKNGVYRKLVLYTATYLKEAKAKQNAALKAETEKF